MFKKSFRAALKGHGNLKYFLFQLKYHRALCAIVQRQLVFFISLLPPCFFAACGKRRETSLPSASQVCRARVRWLQLQGSARNSGQLANAYKPTAGLIGSAFDCAGNLGLMTPSSAHAFTRAGVRACVCDCMRERDADSKRGARSRVHLARRQLAELQVGTKFAAGGSLFADVYWLHFVSC